MLATKHYSVKRMNRAEKSALFYYSFTFKYKTMSKITLTDEQIQINGTTYVPVESLSKSANITGPIKICVLQRGWVYIGRYHKEGNKIELRNAFCIRTWGTTKGLPELVNGATSSTKLDKCEGVVSYNEGSELFTIDVKEESWKQI